MFFTDGKAIDTVLPCISTIGGLRLGKNPIRSHISFFTKKKMDNFFIAQLCVAVLVLKKMSSGCRNGKWQNGSWRFALVGCDYPKPRREDRRRGGWDFNSPNIILSGKIARARTHKGMDEFV